MNLSIMYQSPLGAELPPVLATTMPSLSLLALPFDMLPPYYPLSLVSFPLPLPPPDSLSCSLTLGRWPTK